ncbi:MAG: WGR domain-containing protein [Roseiarcus sp.]
MRRWGRMGSAARQRLEFFDSRDSAGLALETWLARKRRRGYLVR